MPTSRSLRPLIACAALGISCLVFAGAACVAGGPPIDPITGDEGGGLPEQDGGVADAFGDAPTQEPHAVTGAQPSHGPFSGGQRVIVTGAGFAANVRVFFGTVEATEVLPIDATRIQVAAPPGDAGLVEISTQNGEDTSTRRSLAFGYHYDKLYVTPPSAPIAGGTEVTIWGQGTSWASGTSAFLDNRTCTTLSVVSATELRCGVPQGTPGSKTVRVDGGGETISVLDGFSYEDSIDGFKGGLSGAPLAGKLRVLVYNNFTGDPIPGAHVVVGTDINTAIVRDVGLSGVVEIQDASLVGAQTVSVAAHCHSPISFVDVSVDTVTVYLDPRLIPSCGAGGDPPQVGGNPGSSGLVRGEIVFPAINEFERGPFAVPAPIGPDERVVGYVFLATQNPALSFNLPSVTSAVLPVSPGSIGYQYVLSTSPGNRALYALAGIEDRSVNPPRFTAYAMGLVKGVPVYADESTTEVFIPMQPMELALTLAPSPPPPGTLGPDRLLSQVAIRFGNDGFGILPNAQQAPALPLSAPPVFVGVPWLAESLQQSTYYVSSRAVTGPAFLAPMSVVGAVQTNTTAFPLPIDGFVGLPTLLTPAQNAAFDGQTLETQFGPGFPVDLTVYDIAAGNGLARWTVAVPGGSRAITLPDLRALGLGDEGLPSGPLTIGIYGARIDDFDYQKLRYRNLRPAGMSAFSLDYVEAILVEAILP